MTLEALKKQIDEEYDLWIKVSEATLSDGKISCDEAAKWLAWYAGRKKELSLLKKELNLDIRRIRSDYRLKSAETTSRKVKRQLNKAKTLALEPHEHLKQKVERLLLEGEKLKPTLQKQIDEECS